MNIFEKLRLRGAEIRLTEEVLYQTVVDRQPLGRPRAANQVWSMDFVFDRTAEGRVIKSQMSVLANPPNSEQRPLVRRLSSFPASERSGDCVGLPLRPCWY